MNRRELIDALQSFPTGNLCNADPGVEAMSSAIRPLFKGARVCGPAKTARITPGQNRAIHRAVHGAAQDQVLVVDAGSSLHFGPFGDILATCCVNQGLRGLVIDGTVRDATEIEDIGFAVFCLGTNPAATEKSDPGEVDVEITCGGVRVVPGDFVVGDSDGVVVIPADLVETVAANAAEVAAKEEAFKRAMEEGKTTLEILGLTEN